MPNSEFMTYADFLALQTGNVELHNKTKKETYEKYNVKRGLRNKDGTGVVAGITHIGNVLGYEMIDGKKVPAEGRLIYRGYELTDLVNGFLADKRPGFEEIAYLLIFGDLPDQKTLKKFKKHLAECRPLPHGFTEAMILSAPSKDIMNKLARSTLALYSYDDSPEVEPGNLKKELDKAIHLIARFPVIVSNALAAKRHYIDGGSLVIHNPNPELSTAENFLYTVRNDNSYTEEEAQLLDLCLVIQAEHGGGNNSAFTCRVLSSSGTDIYSAIAGAIGSLKGPRHGGANRKVTEMFSYIKDEVNNWEDETELSSYLEKILHREAADRSGLIYGMGHAIYTLSDPRAILLKQLAGKLAETKGMTNEYELIQRVEKLTPEVFAKVSGNEKVMCANLDLYSGFVYKMLGIPEELYTPLFAIARVVGWCSHRLEEVFSDNKIIRPAYKAICPEVDYTPLSIR